ncbi:cell envelope biogenesis protein TolA [Chthonobacter albigriseus]|uniref:cell envelope biogenesis protein TolA n=1 Tax=Chthonobacter albigriseus TaxID=1683161 RepID=UPI0015EEA21E|nr:cell envelope biogenesis protein TolA [Chthonobacter albigriseus]
MRLGLTSSVIGHVLLLTWGLVTLPSAEPFEAVEVDALPVDLVPISDVTEIAEGKKTAPKADTASQGKAKPQLPAPQSQRVGNAPNDQKAPLTEKTTDTAAAPTKEAAPPPPPPPAPKAPQPKPPTPDTAKAEPAPETPKAEPAPPAPAVPPKVEVAELPAEPDKAAEEAKPAPVPAVKPKARPKPPEPVQTASIDPQQALPTETPRKTETKKPTQSKATKPTEKAEDTFNPEDISALLNKVDPSGGGSKASTEEASLGSEREVGPVAQMSQSEIAALQAAVAACWNYPAGADGAESLIVRLRIVFNPDGSVSDLPSIIEQPSGPLGMVAAEGAARAVLRCSPYTFLPPEKYEEWKVVNFRFSPSDMF